MEFTDSKKRIIDISLSDSHDRVVAHADQSLIGEIVFDCVEEDEQVGIQAHLYITRLDIQQAYCRAGIGSKMLEHVKARTGLDIYAAANDGEKKQDGSHLTGDGPGFIAAMRGKGLVVGEREE